MNLLYQKKVVNRKLSLRNNIFNNKFVVSPMCQYSSQDGTQNEWHYHHLKI